MEDVENVIRGWLLSGAWYEDTTEAKQAVVDCIMAQDGWRFVRGRLEHLRREGFHDDFIRTVLRHLLTGLYERHYAPHLDTCPDLLPGARRPATALSAGAQGNAPNAGVRGSVCYTSGCENMANGLNRWERNEGDRYRCGACHADIMRLAPEYSENAGMSREAYLALVDAVLNLSKVLLRTRKCQKCGEPFTLTNLPRATPGANTSYLIAAVCASH